jgi:hypothetical protein
MKPIDLCSGDGDCKVCWCAEINGVMFLNKLRKESPELTEQEARGAIAAALLDEAVQLVCEWDSYNDPLPGDPTFNPYMNALCILEKQARSFVFNAGERVREERVAASQ